MACNYVDCTQTANKAKKAYLGTFGNPNPCFREWLIGGGNSLTCGGLTTMPDVYFSSYGVIDCPVGAAMGGTSHVTGCEATTYVGPGAFGSSCN